MCVSSSTIKKLFMDEENKVRFSGIKVLKDPTLVRKFFNVCCSV